MNFKPVPGQAYLEGYCIIKSVEKKNSSNGTVFLDMTIADNSGEMNAKLWDYRESPSNIWQRFDFVKLRGVEDIFKGAPQFKIFKIRKVTPEDDVDISDYVPSACLPGKDMLEEIDKIVDSFEDDEFRIIVETIMDNHRRELEFWPAAKALHHAVRGGLLMHTLTILRMAYHVCSIYSYVNYDLLCAGIILHDIAKIYEIESSECGIPGEYTSKGNLLGHLVMGAMEIDRTGRQLGIDEEKLTLLEHMLISHHNVPEFGAAKRPMFIEAQVLAALDDFDAKMYEFSSAISETEEGEFTSKQWALDGRPLYNHGLGRDGGVEIK